MRRTYFVLNVCRSGTTESTDAIFILAHPLPCQARRIAWAKEGMLRKILALALWLALGQPERRGKTYAQAGLENSNEI